MNSEEFGFSVLFSDLAYFFIIISFYCFGNVQEEKTLYQMSNIAGVR